MKRETIEKLLTDSGITDEEELKKAVNGIFAEYGKDVEESKAKIEAYEKQISKAEENIKALQDSVKQYEGADIDGLKKSVKDWETKYNADIESLKEEHSRTVKNYTLKEALTGAGCLDPDYAIYKLGGVDGFNFNDDGSVFGLEDTIKSFKESNPAQFAQTGGSGYNPPGGGAPGGAADTSKMSYSELCDYFKHKLLTG